MGMYDNAPAGFDNASASNIKLYQDVAGLNEISHASDIPAIQPGSLDWLKSMAKDNPEYAEKLFDYLVNQQNVTDARAYDQYVRSHNYQWMSEDLRKAGLNPYLALNSLGGSSGANIQAQGGTYGASSAKNSKDLGNNRILALLLASLLGVSGKLISTAMMA